jgi:branched-chain amino acid transport system ATP-binding protein
VTIPTKPVLRVEQLSVAYGAIRAVREVSLCVGAGEAVAVIGSNGAGKSSMLRGIMQLVKSRSTLIELFGEAVNNTATHAFVRHGVGYVPEGRELFMVLTVEEEMLIGGRRLARTDRAPQLERMFALFPRLKERRRQVTRTLSGGEQQMVAIARTLMGQPRLLLLDEPSLGLAPIIQDTVFDALGRLRADGLPILIVEQNAFRALKLCDRAYVIELGRITREGSSEAFRSDESIRSAYLGK